MAGLFAIEEVKSRHSGVEVWVSEEEREGKVLHKQHVRKKTKRTFSALFFNTL